MCIREFTDELDVEEEFKLLSHRCKDSSWLTSFHGAPSHPAGVRGLSLTPAAAFAVHGNLQIVTMEGELPRATLSGRIIGLLIE